MDRLASIAFVLIIIAVYFLTWWMYTFFSDVTEQALEEWGNEPKKR